MTGTVQAGAVQAGAVRAGAVQAGAVFVAGALHLDVVVRAPRLPALDETLMGEAVAYRLGGKGANQAVAAARMGARAAMAGVVGTDAFGRQILEEMNRLGVECAQVAVREGASGMSVAIVEPSGEYGAVVVSGVNRQFDPEAVEIGPEAAVLCLQNEVPVAANLALARRARAAGVRLIVNAAPATPEVRPLAALADVLVVNRGEAGVLWGGIPDALSEDMPRDVIVTLGAEGLAWLRRGTAPRRLPALAVRAISAHGAGDVFVGALAAELAAGAQMARALEIAQAAAALFVSLPDGDRMELSREGALALLAARRPGR